MMTPLDPFRLTLRAVLLFEKLTARSFSSIDLQDEDDAQVLIYCLQRNTSNGSRLPLELWRSTLKSEAVRAEYYRVLGLAIEELGEVSIGITKGNSEEADALGVTYEDAPTFTSIASMLIISGGLDAGYVMDQLELWELPALLKGLEQRTRERMEHSRLFTWLIMLPHLSRDAADSPEKILPFPWEKPEEDETRCALYDFIATARYSPDH